MLNIVVSSEHSKLERILDIKQIFPAQTLKGYSCGSHTDDTLNYSYGMQIKVLVNWRIENRDTGWM